MLRKAFQEAQSGVPGPVFVELPIDTLYPFERVFKETIPSVGHCTRTGVLTCLQEKSGKAPVGFVPKLVDAYLRNYTYRLFAGGTDAFLLL